MVCSSTEECTTANVSVEEDAAGCQMKNTSLFQMNNSTSLNIHSAAVSLSRELTERLSGALPNDRSQAIQILDEQNEDDDIVCTMSNAEGLSDANLADGKKPGKMVKSHGLVQQIK